MLHLEGAEAPGEPSVGKSVRGGDREKRLIFFAMAREGSFDRIEGARKRREQPLSQRRQASPSFLAHEQGRAEPLLKAFDLVGNGGLGHPQLSRCRREILCPGRRLESPDRSEWRKAPHQLTS